MIATLARGADPGDHDAGQRHRDQRAGRHREQDQAERRGRRLQLITDVGDAGRPTGEREPAGDEDGEDGARRPYLGEVRVSESRVGGGRGMVGRRYLPASWPRARRRRRGGEPATAGERGEAGRDRGGPAEVLAVPARVTRTGAQGVASRQVAAPDLHQLAQASGDRDGDVVARVEVAHVDLLAAEHQPPGPQLGRRHRRSGTPPRSGRAAASSRSTLRCRSHSNSFGSRSMSPSSPVQRIPQAPSASTTGRNSSPAGVSS